MKHAKPSVLRGDPTWATATREPVSLGDASWLPCSVRMLSWKEQKPWPVGIWWFPEIGVPLVIIHFTRIFPYKPSILGYPHLWKAPLRIMWTTRCQETLEGYLTFLEDLLPCVMAWLDQGIHVCCANLPGHGKMWPWMSFSHWLVDS